MRGELRLLLALSFVLVACGPSPRSRPGGGSNGDGTDAQQNGNCTPSSENTPATCSDGIDNDCDGLTDCQDPDCSGIGQCPVCGMVEHPTGQPVDLPDGVGGTTCTTDADCASVMPGPQRCFDTITSGKQCRQSYTSKLHFTAFGPTQTMTMVSDIQSVCVNMSHEWIRDLEIDLVSPSGQKIALDKFEGQQCTSGVCEVYLGNPLNTDSDCAACTTEMGMDYCWKPTATNAAILAYADSSGTMQTWNSHSVLPPGDYGASDPWTNLVGSTLNGDWTIAVTDLWPIDAGKLHSWTLSFNPAIVQNCSGPVIQ
jgi:hypothetical protein